MKCTHCLRDCKYRERTNGKCPHCQHAFAFEPRNGDACSDGLFHSAIQAVSDHGVTRWHADHLYYELCRRLRSKMKDRMLLMAGGAIVAFAAAMISLSTKSAVPMILGMVLSIILFGCAAVDRPKYPLLTSAQFDRLYEKWVAAHGSPPGVIVQKNSNAAKGRKRLAELEPDVADYSFDRAVICDRESTVDVLLANHFHFENNCAILSIDGYPAGPFETVRKMLKQNPKLKVYAIHDATVKGCQLAERLATDPEWFGDGQAQVIDVGLRPSHAPRFEGLWKRNRSQVVPESAAITRWEAEWLAQHALELAVVRPEQLIKRLFKAINLELRENPAEVIYLPARHPVAANERGVGVDGGGGGGGGGDTSQMSAAYIISNDAHDSDGAADSFG